MPNVWDDPRYADQFVREPIDVAPARMPMPQEQPSFLRQMWDEGNSRPLSRFVSPILRRIAGTEGDNPYSVRGARMSTGGNELLDPILGFAEGGLEGAADFLDEGGGAKIANRFADVRHEGQGDNWYKDALLGGLEGLEEGASNVTTGLTTPFNLATGALGKGARTALASGNNTRALLLNRMERGMSIPVMASGAQKMLSPESTMAERGWGATEFAGGALGVGDELPMPKPRPFPIRPNGPRPMMEPPNLREQVPDTAVPAGESFANEVMGSMDPNFNGGMGDPLLAGSQPYRRPPPPPEPPPGGGGTRQPLQPNIANYEVPRRNIRPPEEIQQETPPFEAPRQIQDDYLAPGETGFDPNFNINRRNPLIYPEPEQQNLGLDFADSVIPPDAPPRTTPRPALEHISYRNPDGTENVLQQERPEIPGGHWSDDQTFNYTLAPDHNFFPDLPPIESMRNMQPGSLSGFARDAHDLEKSLSDQTPDLGPTTPFDPNSLAEIASRVKNRPLSVMNRQGQPMTRDMGDIFATENFRNQGQLGLEGQTDLAPTTAETGMVPASETGMSRIGPKAQEFLDYENRVGRPFNTDTIDNQSFLDSLDWERDFEDGPGMNPNDAAGIVRNATGKDVDIFSTNGPRLSSRQPEVPALMSGQAEVLSSNHVKHGDTVELAISDTGGTFWADNLTDPAKIQRINDGLRNGTLEIVQRTGGTDMRNVTPRGRGEQRQLGEGGDFLGDEEPSFAKVEGGGLKASMNVDRGITNLTKDYTSPLGGIMVREGLQNAMDAIQSASGGEIKVRIAEGKGGTPGTIEIADNGAGLDEDGLANKLFEVFATGKDDDPNATGGKGIGSASYLFGGQHIEIESVAVDKTDGKTYLIKASGTPKQLQTTGSDYTRREINPHTRPTGLKMKVTLTPQQTDQIYSPQYMINNIRKFSRNRKGTLIMDPYGKSASIDDLKPGMNNAMISEHTFKDNSTDKLIGDFTTQNSRVKVYIPEPEPTIRGGKRSDTRDSIHVQFLNNGMYQFNSTIDLPESAKGVPENVLVDIHSLVDEQHDDYPFINTREDVKKDLREQVMKFVQENISKPALNQKKNKTQALYDSMTEFNIGNTKSVRKQVLFDPGNRLTPDELQTFENSPLIKNLMGHYDRAINDILNATGMDAWHDRLEGVGIVLDPNLHGVHIPNPTTKKSTILLNPFARFEEGMSPHDAAFDGTITLLHEVAHIGSEAKGSGLYNPTFTPAELADSRIGKYFQSFLQQVHGHGDVGYTSTGHGVGFIQRLGEVYAKVGAGKTFDLSDKLASIFSSGQNDFRGYSPEVQGLLQIYSDSRGRDAVTEDLLSGTGVKQKTPAGGTGDIPSPNPTDGDGVAGSGQRNRRILKDGSATSLKRAIEAGYNPVRFLPGGKVEIEFVGKDKMKKQPLLEEEVGDPAKKVKEPKEVHLLRQIWDNSRGFMSVDPPWMTSAAFRQAAPHAGTLSWFKAWGKAATSFGTEAAYKAQMDKITSDPLFKKRPGPRGSEKASFAEEMGVRMTDLSDTHSARQEGIKNKFAENFPIYGDYVKASNRAFAGFLNNLRYENFKSFVEDGRAQAKATKDNKLDPLINHDLARAYARFLNDTTGAGSIDTKVPTFSGDLKNPSSWKVGAKNVGYDEAAHHLADVFFSPRLNAARAHMLDPQTYIFNPPQVRKAYAHAMLRSIGMWWGLAQLASTMGLGSVNSDPTNPDFGKIKIGNTRLDPGAGFQQWLVLGAQIKPRGMKLGNPTHTGSPLIDLPSGLMSTPGAQYTSSNSGETRVLGEGYNPETRYSRIQNFAANKLHPAAKFMYDLAHANKQQPVYMGDRLMQMFVPMMAGDLVELIKSDPSLIPLVLPMTGAGMGSQTYESGPQGPQITPGFDWFADKIGSDARPSQMDWKFQGNR